MKTLHLKNRKSKILNFLYKLIGFLLAGTLLAVSFYGLHGWKFWVSQVIGWFALLNIFVFGKLFSMLKDMPDLKKQ